MDTPREILANKLSALLGRSEIRDLVDVRALLEAGHDLVPALEDASAKDSGFSVFQLAWVLRNLPLVRIARAEGRADEEVVELTRFRDDLVERLTSLTRPPNSD